MTTECPSCYEPIECQDIRTDNNGKDFKLYICECGCKAAETENGMEQIN